MDASLLKRTAIQCLALMIAVITFSYALKQYQEITIQASGQTIRDYNFYEAWKVLQQPTNSQTPPVGVEKDVKNKLGTCYLVIEKPKGDHVEIDLEDIYINQSIRLTISGMTTDKMADNTISRVRDNQVFVGMPSDKSEADSVEHKEKKDPCYAITSTSSQDKETMLFTQMLMLKLDKVYAYIIYEDANNFYIDLRKPSEVYDKILVIDAGHGGKDVGAISWNDDYYEKNVNLAIVKDLKELLDKEKIKVYYTRTEDDTVYLKPRSTLANAVDCDYFISIHCNANGTSYPNGSEILYTNNEYKNVENSELAKLLSKEIMKNISLKNRGIVKMKQDDIYIMDKAKVPMVLIEVGYVTNKSDMKYMSKSSNRKVIAQGIYNGIMKAYKQLPVK